jgi:hypothetical protein
MISNPEQYRIALAWHLYCFDTQGSMDCRDYWSQLSKSVQEMYLKKADAEALTFKAH